MGRPSGLRGQQGEGRQRALAAAIDLFSQHGLHGTSLQMIADRVGVTKAAIHQQFGSKEKIGLVLLEPLAVGMEEIIAAVTGVEAAEARSQAAISGLIDLVVQHRRTVAALFRDSVLEQMAATDPQWASVTRQLAVMVDGPEPGEERRVALVIFTAGLAQVVVDPRTKNLSDDELRTGLVRAAGRLLG